MTQLTFQFDDETFLNNLKKLRKEYPDRISRGLSLVAESVMTISKTMAPVDLGTLRSSGQVKPVKRENLDFSVELIYGGAASEYASIQHERLDYFHSVGQAKYLEEPLRRHKIMEEFAGHIKL